MLPKEHRLKAREDFDRIFRHGRPLSLGEILCFSLPREEGEVSRIGITFKGKAFPRATLRNWYKRKMTEALRERLSEIPPNINCVLLFRGRLSDEHFDVFREKAGKIVRSLTPSSR